MTFVAKLLPSPHLAYPVGWHDRLLKAAIHADEAQALAHAEAWLDAHDIDSAAFREHRLLVAVAARFGDRLAGFPAYARLVALRRALWARSLFSLREASPTLAVLANSLDVMPFKGAARLAEGGARRGERVAYDIDIIVRPDDMARAFAILVDQGWQPAEGVSPAYARAHLAGTRGINMFRGRYGDLDLHALPFHPGQGDAADDAAFWARSTRATLETVPVRLPAPDDALALAIAHGGLDAHAHSDWLVDAARLVGRGTLDWDCFLATVTSRTIQAPALFALGYLSREAAAEIPARVLTELSRAATAEPFRYVAAFLQARPRDRAGIVGNILRGFAKSLRKRTGERQMRRMPDRRLTGRRMPLAVARSEPALAPEHQIELPDGARPGRRRFRAVLQLATPPVARRIELELNGTGGHIGRIRYDKWDRARLVTLSVTGIIDLPPDETALSLVSRPSRLLRPEVSPADRDRYAALPFRVVRLEIIGVV